jgi:hypothetical protein
MPEALWLWLLGHLIDLEASLDSFGGFPALYLPAGMYKLLGWLQSVCLFGNCKLELVLRKNGQIS